MNDTKKSNSVTYTPADLTAGESPSLAELMDPNKDGELDAFEYDASCGIMYGSTSAEYPLSCSVPFRIFRAVARKAEKDPKAAARHFKNPNITHPYFKPGARGDMSPEGSRRAYLMATTIFETVRRAKDASPELVKRKLAQACLLFEKVGQREMAGTCYRMILSLVQKEGDENETAYYRAMYALSEKKYDDFRREVAKLAPDFPGSEGLRKIVADLDKGERAIETWMMTAAMGETYKARIKETSEDWKAHILDAVGLYDRASAEDDIASIDAFIGAWKSAIERGKGLSTREILTVIWNKGNDDARRGLFLMMNLKSRHSVSPEEFYNFDVEGALPPISLLGNADAIGGSDHVRIGDLVRIEEADAKMRPKMFERLFRDVAANAGDEGTAALASVGQAAVGSRELGDVARRLMQEEITDPDAVVIARNAVKGLTSPINMALMVGGFALARLTTTAVMARLAPVGVEHLPFAARLPFTAGEISIEAGAFTLYHNILSELITTHDVNWGPGQMTGNAADLALRFACARILAIPLLGVKRAMGISERFGTGKLDIDRFGKLAGELNMAGRRVFAVTENLGTTAGFYAGGHISHSLGLSERAGTFIEEEILLLQFQLGTKAADKVSGGAIGKATERIAKANVERIAKIAEKLADGREKPEWEIIARHLMWATAEGKVSPKDLNLVLKAVSSESIDPKLLPKINDVLMRAGLPFIFEDSPTLSGVRESGVSRRNVGPRVGNMLGVEDKPEARRPDEDVPGDGPRHRIQILAGSEGRSLELGRGGSAELSGGVKVVIKDNRLQLNTADAGTQVQLNGEEIPQGREVPLAGNDEIVIGTEKFQIMEGDGTLARREDIEVDPAGVPFAQVTVVNITRSSGERVEGIGKNGSSDVLHIPGVQVVQRTADGGEALFLEDLRDSPQARRERSVEDGVLFSRDNEVIYLNGRIVQRGLTRLKTGDVLQAVTLEVVVAIPAETSMPDISRLPKWRQRTTAQKIHRAKSFAEIGHALFDIEGANTAGIGVHLHQVALGYVPLASVPESLGLRKKVKEAMAVALLGERLAPYRVDPSKYAVYSRGLTDPVEREYKLAVELESLARAVESARDMDELAKAIGDSGFDRIDNRSRKDLAQGLKEMSATGEAGTSWLPEVAGIRAKAKRLAGRVNATLTGEINLAGDIPALISVLEGSGLAELGGRRMEHVIDALEALSAEGGSGVEGLPRTAGLRQRARDIIEERDMERAMMERGEPEAAIAKLGERAKHLLDGIRQWREKIMTPLTEEAREQVYQVLERGLPVETLTREGDLRYNVDHYIIEPTIGIARELYPREMNVEVNPYSGERVREKDDSQYRLARNILNRHMDLPIHGLPTPTETRQLIRVVRTRLGKETSDYLSAQKALRTAIDGDTYPAHQMLKEATPADKALILETYFGNYTHRDMPDGAAAFRVAAMLGLSGMYREVGVTFAIERGNLHANVSLGDLGSVSPEAHHLFFLMHTHPEEYKNERGEMMGEGGRKGGAAATMIFDKPLEFSRDSRNIMFSETDIRLFVRDAERYLSRPDAGGLGNTPFYDPQQGIYKNWVLHPFGGSRVNVHMEGGRPKKVVIYYYIGECAGRIDDNYKYQMGKLERLVKDELHLEFEIRKIGEAEFMERLPYGPVQR